MASIYDLKPKFQSVLRPVMRGMASAGLTANAVTLLALVGSLGVGVAVAFAGTHRLLLLAIPVWLFIRMALNAIDGMMARELDQSTDLGAVLNELGDVVSDASIYLPLAVAFPDASASVVAFVLAAAVTEFCGVLGQALGAERHYEGPMGKSDRAFAVGAMAVLMVVYPAAVGALPWVLGIATVLAAWTCINRIRGALADLRAEAASGEAAR